jgi:hypothetical protein
MSSRSISLAQAQAILNTFESAYASANSDLATKKKAVTTAQTSYRELIGSGASQSQLQSQAAILNSAQTSALIAQNYAKDLVAASAAAQNVINASGGVTGPVGGNATTDNPFVGSTGPAGPASSAGSITVDSTPTVNSTNAITSGGVYQTVQALQANTSSVIVGTSTLVDDGFTKLLYHFDGLDGAVQGPGLTYDTYVATCSAGASLLAYNPKFGTACLNTDYSGACAFPNPYPSGIPTNGSAFTLEFFFRFSANNSTQFTLLTASPDIYFQLQPTQQFAISYNNNGSTAFTNIGYNHANLAGAWHHVAFSKSATANSAVYVYLDGIQLTTITNTSGRNYFPVANFTTGNCVCLDELRFSVGVDRYPGGTKFIPPTAPFTNNLVRVPNLPASGTKGQLWTDGTDVYLCTASGTPGSWSKKVTIG